MSQFYISPVKHNRGDEYVDVYDRDDTNTLRPIARFYGQNATQNALKFTEAVSRHENIIGKEMTR